MYPFLLTLHNVLRWLVLVFAVLALVRAFSGLSGRKKWTQADDKAGLFYTMSLDLQVLVGLLLFFVASPITTEALKDFGAAMASSVLRYFTVEHTLMMLVAVVLAHIGRSLSKRAKADRSKFRQAAIWFGVSVLVLLAAIPWPFLANGRPWLRLFGFDF